MLQFRSRIGIEIFNQDFKFIKVLDTGKGQFNIELDYLSLNQNEIIIYDDSNEVKIGQYIVIHADDKEYVGIIDNVERKEFEEVVIRFKSLLSLFDKKILFDTNLQGKQTYLEDFIKKTFDDIYATNSDTLQNLKGFKSIIDNKSILEWGFNLKSDVENMHHCIINLYDSILVKAFEKYELVVLPHLNVESKIIEFHIKKINGQVKTIEANLSNVIRKKVVLNKNEKSINKLTVYDDKDFKNSVTMYLHPNGKYDTNDTDRIVPVIDSIVHVSIEENKTLLDMAKYQASEVFGTSKNNQLIELEVLNEDNWVRPIDLEIGQRCNIIIDDTVYQTILSGKKISKTTTLVFGTIRRQLTKKIRKERLFG